MAFVAGEILTAANLEARFIAASSSSITANGTNVSSLGGRVTRVATLDGVSALYLLFVNMTNGKGSNWAAPDLLATLPVGFRPSGTNFMTAVNINSNTNVRGTIASDGTIKFTSGTVANGDAVYCNAMTYVGPWP